MPLATKSPWAIYASELVRLGYGHPLWHPEPTKFGEVVIGDVGFIEEGGFYRLFNAMADETDAVNKSGVPEGFTKLVLDEEQRHRLEGYLPKGPICSKSTKGTEIEVSVGASPVP